jgi:hypothetical protein
MTINKPISALLGVVLAALAVAGSASSASAVSVRPAAELQPAVGTGSPVVSGQACPDVMVIGARGTDEGPTTNTGELSSYAADPYKGVGRDIDTMYTDLATANRQLTWGLEPALYATNVNLVAFARDVAKYPEGAATGAESITLDIQTTDLTCPHPVHYILAGYSLGAWAVHDALLNQLRSVQGEIIGVALFGDPKFIPSQPIDKPINMIQDPAFGVATAVPDAADIPPGIPSALVARTGSWCFRTDPICQSIGVAPAILAIELAGCVRATKTNNPSLCAHLLYWKAESADAAAFLQPFLPPPGGTWGTAIQVPGMASLDTSESAGVMSLSCASAGNCSADGFYTDGSGQQAFVANEVNGTWGNAVAVPGTTTLNAGGNAMVLSLSCASAGNCSAGGYYTDGSYHDQAFVANEVNGTWGNAVEVPGTATLNAGGNATVQSLSCASAGNCSAGGLYRDGSGQQAFVAGEVNGAWGNAVEVPGTETLNADANASVQSLSCASAGNCSAGGFYTDGSAHAQAFVAGEVNGTWGNAVEVPGTTTLNAGGGALVLSLSCASAGNCSAGGFYIDGSSGQLAFVVSES